MRGIKGERVPSGLPVRTEPVTIGPGLVLLGLTFRLVAVLARTLYRHPVAAAALGVVFVVLWRGGLLGLGALAGGVGLVMIGWGLAHRPSFLRVMRWAGSRARLALIYRPRWRAVTVHCGLAIRTPTALGERVAFADYLPRLRAIRAEAGVDRLRVEMLPGQTPAMWERRAEALGHALRARACVVTVERPGFVWVELHRHSLAVPRHEDIPDVQQAVPLARHDDATTSYGPGAEWVDVLLRSTRPPDY
jgi:S-DNA-T family DNA segregation ATPase FtsK/SpoIIIE